VRGTSTNSQVTFGYLDTPQEKVSHPGVELRANLKSISHRCYLFEVEFVWELTKETIHLPLGCLQGGEKVRPAARESREV